MLSVPEHVARLWISLYVSAIRYTLMQSSVTHPAKEKMWHPCCKANRKLAKREQNPIWQSLSQLRGNSALKVLPVPSTEGMEGILRAERERRCWQQGTLDNIARDLAWDSPPAPRLGTALLDSPVWVKSLLPLALHCLPSCPGNCTIIPSLKCFLHTIYLGMIAYSQYGPCAVLTPGADVAELDSTSVAIITFSATSDSGTLRCFKICASIWVSSHADVCPSLCVWLLLEGKSSVH